MTVRHHTLRGNYIAYLRRDENVALLSWTCASNNSDLNRVDHAICGLCRSESTTAGTLTPWISWSDVHIWIIT